MNYMARFIFVIICLVLVVLGLVWHFNREHVYQQMLERLQAESRAAQVLVTAVNYDEASHRNMTTIKFVEQDSAGQALPPQYFTFSGNLIQFQSLVVRFEDKFVARATALKRPERLFILEGVYARRAAYPGVSHNPCG